MSTHDHITQNGATEPTSPNVVDGEIQPQKLWHRTVDLRGKKFGLWTVLGISEERSAGAAKWICRCECGTISRIARNALLKGTSKGCRECFKKRQSAKARDLVGKKFGKWTVLRRAGTADSRNRRYYWVCQCECGTIAEVIRCNLVRGSSVSCFECGRTATRIPIEVGEVYGQFTVIAPPITKGLALYYPCRCSCGTVRNVAPGDLKSGKRFRCRKCAIADMRGPWRAFFKTIRTGADVRGLEVTVTLDFLIDLLERQGSRCALSGLPIHMPDKTAGGCVRTASLDRIDSKLGYTPSNVQFVHKTINIMKQTLSDEVFVEFCRAVARHHSPKSKPKKPAEPNDNQPLLI